MDLHDAVTPIPASHERQHQAETRLHGRWLLLARIVWFALVAFTLSVCMVSLPVYLSTLHTVCRQAFCSYGQLSPQTVVALEHVGLSVGSYVTFMLALAILFALVYFVTGGLIFWRKSDDWMALLFALLLVAGGTAPVLSTLASSHLAKPLPIQGVWELIALVWVLCFTLFPDGRFVPRWSRWLFVGYSLVTVVVIFFTNPFNGFFPGPLWLTGAAFLLLSTLFVGLVIAQVYRYRYVSTPLQRQQAKWVLYGLSAIIVWSSVGGLLTLIFHLISPPVYTIVSFCILFLYPLTLSFAILRYRLWEIDVLINRTLVYGSLTALLALIYFGLVIGLESLVRLFTGQVSASPVIIVASTLVIAALFQPLRHRLQQLIDRRFYRSKYDAAKTVAAFSATLRNEADLTRLREQLLAVVQETMQPTFVSLWLRPPAHDEKQRAPWRTTPPGSSEGG